jgi:hypothetical protein
MEARDISQQTFFIDSQTLNNIVHIDKFYQFYSHIFPEIKQSPNKCNIVMIWGSHSGGHESTDVSEEHVASIFTVGEASLKQLASRAWR